MGYTYIALGGLVRSTTQEILNTLEAIAKIRNKLLLIDYLDLETEDLDSTAIIGIFL